MALWSVLPAGAQEGTYQQAKQAHTQGRTEDAIRGYCSLGDYRDAAQRCQQLQSQLEELSRRNENNYQSGIRAFQSGNYSAARQYFEQVTGPRYDAAQDYLENKIPAAMARGSRPASGVEPIATTPFARGSASPARGAGAKAQASQPNPKQAKTTISPAATASSPAANGSAPATLSTAATGTDADLALKEAVRDYYQGGFGDAESKLQQYLDNGGSKRGVAQFYLGAVRLSRYYLAGARQEDASLMSDAETAFQAAQKVEGFMPPEQYVSPKILEAYRASGQ
jgi:TolA-binding protein